MDNSDQFLSDGYIQEDSEPGKFQFDIKLSPVSVLFWL